MSKQGCLKWIAIISGFMLVLIIAAYLIFNEKEPTGSDSAEAKIMAEKMLRAVNKEAWDSLAYVSWSFPGGHHYVWDKKRHYVEVKWGDNRVLLNPNEVAGVAFKGSKQIAEPEANKLVQKAWNFFCNDSFWLNAPVMAFDSGTERSIVDIDGKKGLKVSYTSGGVTPGDSYVWFLNDQGLPTAYKMWVKIIPIGGLEFSWDNWIELPGGAKVASRHKSKGPTLELTNIKGGDSFTDFGFETDPFVELERLQLK